MRHPALLGVVLTAWLLGGWIDFAQGESAVLTPPGADVLPLDLSSANAWKAEPIWLGNPDSAAQVKRVADGLEFFVPSAGKGMKWSTHLPSACIREQRFLVLRYKAFHLDTSKSDYAVYLNDRQEEQFNAIRLDELMSDGQWHVTVAYLPARTKAVRVCDSAAVQVQAAQEGEARLVVSDLFLTDAVQPEILTARVRAEVERFEGTPKEGFRLEFAPLQDWKERPSWFPKDLAGRASVAVEGRAARFSVEGPSKSRMKWSWNLPSPVDMAGFPYVALRYKATNLGQTNDYALFIGGGAEGNTSQGAPVLHASDLECDGAWHTVGGRVGAQVSRACEIAIQVEAEKDGRADLWIESLAFLDRPTKILSDLPEYAEGFPHDGADFRTVDLPPGGVNEERICRLTNLRSWFPKREVTIAGIPFKLEEPQNAAIGTALRAGDSKVVVPISGQAKEVWLLLAAQFRGEDEPGFGGPRREDPRKAQKFRPITAIREPIRLCVELVHEEGSDFAMPVHVARREHVITRGLGLYCIPTRLKSGLKRLILHDDTPLAALYVAGVTLNVSPRPRLAGFERDEPSISLKYVPPPPLSQPSVVIEGRRIILRGPTYRYEFEAASGLRLLRASNEAIATPVTLKPSAFNLFMVKQGDYTIPCSEFEVENLRRGSERDAVEVLLASPKTLTKTRILATLRMKAEPFEVICDLSLKNLGTTEIRPTVFFPDLGGLSIGSGKEMYYFYPMRGAAFGNEPCAYRHPYGGAFPFQFVDLYNPVLGGGLYVRTMDRDLNWKWFLLTKREDTRLAVEYHDRSLAPGQERSFPTTALGMHVGDWRAALGAYRRWLMSWYRPVASRPKWFREVFNFRQEFLYFIPTKLFDRKTKRFDILGEIADVKQQFGGCDYMHIFDWGATKQFGRCGDYNHWEDMGGLENFRQAVRAAQAAGVPVGLYIEGYLVSPASNLGKAYGEQWQLLDAEGKPYPYYSPDYNMCPNVTQWQDYLAATYKRVAQETGAKGFYIDEFGFASQGHFCFNKGHDHEIPAPPLRGETELTRKVRAALNAVSPDIVLYTEESPCDVTSQYQDGSFTYALSAHRNPPEVLSLYRFVIPDFKLFEIIVCDAPLGGNYDAVRRVFFNGNGLWIEGRAGEWFTPKTRAEIARLYAVLREHKDAFTSSRPAPLIPTLRAGILANEFPSDSGDKTVFTLFNSNYWSVGGEVLSIPHKDGVRYFDAFSKTELPPNIRNGQAVIRMDLAPRDVGCIVARRT